MKIILTSETSIRLLPDTGPMTVEARSVEQQYSPFHMLGSSLAFCTFSVLYSWATHVKLPVDDLAIDVAWDFIDDPHRVGTIRMTFDWPSLPAKRLNAARRAAELCTIHATLMHSPSIEVHMAGEATGGETAARPAAGAVSEAEHASPAPRSTAEATAMKSSHDDREQKGAQQGAQEHAHEHTHADGTTHSHPHAHDAEHRHAHAGDALARGEVEIQHGSDETGEPADLPPRPSQQGDGQETGTAREARPSPEAR